MPDDAQRSIDHLTRLETGDPVLRIGNGDGSRDIDFLLFLASLGVASLAFIGLDTTIASFRARR